ncbi:cathepsin B-like isoform X2 [Diaphorina citri]|uniref:Cathepsin B-like isoform X2 n=1 Tax=Diaphorina citri TaxID=121845 RepID=A0A1S3D8F9_DIACI|nr:cathepsin B-like isoform X2 [Diaphorina citri]
MFNMIFKVPLYHYVPAYKGSSTCNVALFLSSLLLISNLFYRYLGVTNGDSTDIDWIPDTDDFINYINSVQSFWVAEKNALSKLTLSELEMRMGVHPDSKLPQNRLPLLVQLSDPLEELPEGFDARINWPYCPTIQEIRDQGSCGSGWALGAVEAMSDRVCIASRGKRHVRLSSDDLVSCCKDCGNGCQGGFHGKAWKYWVTTGIVSGGTYASKQGCRPYEIPCERYMNGSRSSCQANEPNTPECIRKCQPGYDVSYEDDLNFGRIAYSLPANEETIMREIFRHGPVEGSMTIYADMILYKTGIYKHVAGGPLGEHAIRIIGWGQEPLGEGTSSVVKYWLVANSFNTNWGENGLFRIVRGQNECGIEADITAGLPKIGLEIDSNEINLGKMMTLPLTNRE